MRISATIVTLNEERNIARAIESLGCADEVLIVDSGSTDRTREIALRLGARVIEEPWRGYAGQKNYAAACAAYDWILSIDADESLTPDLTAEIVALKSAVLKSASIEADGYSFPRLAQYLGRWIRHGGWYPDRKVRLYNRAKAEWTGDYVHESVRVNGLIGQLHGDLLHFTCQSLSEHLRTLDRYTSLAAREIAARNKRVPIRRLALDPAWTFIRAYILQRGFLDGPQGLAIAWMAALYTFLKYAKALRGFDIFDISNAANPPSR
jgi:glycosyltransferase involved in cell wall biosynthesis